MSEPSPVRVVAVDDHPMVRMGLKLTLCSSDEVEVVREAEDVEEALRVCAEVHPDSMHMNAHLPLLTCAPIQHRYSPLADLGSSSYL